MTRIEERLEAMQVDTSEMTTEQKFTAATGLTHYDEETAANDWYVPGGAANVLGETEETVEEPENQEPIEDDPVSETYTITFMNGDEVVKTVTGETGTSVSAPDVEKEGFEFNGWSLDGENPILPVDAIVDSDLTYVALWFKVDNEEPDPDPEPEPEPEPDPTPDQEPENNGGEENPSEIEVETEP